MKDNQSLTDALTQAIVSSLQGQQDDAEANFRKPPTDKPAQQYAIGEEVDVQSWGGVKRAKIEGVDWIFHSRLGEWTWGYSLDRSVGLTFRFVPEGYLRKI